MPSINGGESLRQDRNGQNRKGGESDVRVSRNSDVIVGTGGGSDVKVE